MTMTVRTDSQRAAVLNYRRMWRALIDEADRFDREAVIAEKARKPLTARTLRQKAIVARQGAVIAHHAAYNELANLEPYR